MESRPTRSYYFLWKVVAPTPEMIAHAMVMLASSCFLGASRPPIGVPAVARAGALRMYDMPVDPSRYGLDPRSALPEEERVADASFVATTPGEIGMLDNINELQAAIDAAGDKQVLAIKFIRDNCLACASTKELFEEACKEFGAAGAFYLCDYDVRRREWNSRPPRQLCELQV